MIKANTAMKQFQIFVVYQHRGLGEKEKEIILMLSALDPCVTPQQEVQHTALRARHALSGTVSVIFPACVYVGLIDLLCLNSVSGVLFSSAGRT